MNKLLLTVILACLASFLFAQEYVYDNATIEIKKTKAPSKVCRGCISILIQVSDLNTGTNLQGIEIKSEGQKPDTTYISDKNGAVLIVDKSNDIVLLLNNPNSIYSAVKLAGLKLKKGKHYTISVKLVPKLIEEPIDPIDPIEPIDPKEPVYEVFKPIIYFYPSQPTDLELKLQVNGELTFSYPKYKEGWTCTAMPDGTIKIGEKTYPYLFWEGKIKSVDPEIQKTGFVVKSENIVSFLEEKLSHIGLNDKEMADFITFWAPRLEQNAYSYLHFSIGEEYSKNIATLEMNIRPDSELHLHLFNAPVGSDFKVQSQDLPQFQRKGFSLVEWGGGPIELNNDY